MRFLCRQSAPPVLAAALSIAPRQWTQRRDGIDYMLEQRAGHHDLGHLEGDRAPVVDDLRADLHQTVSQRRQRPMADRIRDGQGEREVPEVGLIASARR